MTNQTDKPQDTPQPDAADQAAQNESTQGADQGADQQANPADQAGGEPLQQDTTHQGVGSDDTLQGGSGGETTPPVREGTGEDLIGKSTTESTADAAKPAEPAPAQAPAVAATPAVAPKPATVGLSGKGANKVQPPQVTQAKTPAPTNATPSKAEKAAQAPAQTNATGATKIEPRASKQEIETDEAALERILRDVPASSRGSVGKVKQYIDQMKPNRPLDPAVGARQQIGLYRTLYNLINSDSEHFEALWRAILKLVENHRNGAFHPANAFRFLDSDSFTLNKDETMSFRALIDLLVLTSASKGRDIAAKTYDFEQALRYAQTENGRARVLKFYGR